MLKLMSVQYVTSSYTINVSSANGWEIYPYPHRVYPEGASSILTRVADHQCSRMSVAWLRVHLGH